MQIKVERHELSDTSEVFDVVLIQGGQRIVLHAYTQRDAHQVSAALVDAISHGTAETIRAWEA